MPTFTFSPVEGDPFASADARAAYAPPSPAESLTSDLGLGLQHDVSRLVGGFGNALTTVGNSLMGNTSVGVSPSGAVTPIDPSLVDSANVLAGAVMEGGLAAPRPEGSLGTLGGIRAKTADLDALAKAKDMESSGLRPGAIWSNTGWWRGPDDQWRFEIPDQQAHYRSDVIKPYSPSDNADWMGHYHDFLEGQGYIGRETYTAPKELKDAASNYASWNVGTGAPINDLYSHPALFEAYPQLKDAFVQRLEHPSALGRYLPEQNVVEMSPADSGRYGNYTPTQVMAHELQHGVQSIEGFGMGGSPSDPAVEQLGNLVKANAGNRMANLRDKIARGNATDSDHVDYMAAAQVYHKIKDTPPGDLGYHTLAGEVESRNVENRLTRDADIMKELSPEVTMDVPRWMQNVRILKDWLR